MEHTEWKYEWGNQWNAWISMAVPSAKRQRTDDDGNASPSPKGPPTTHGQYAADATAGKGPAGKTKGNGNGKKTGDEEPKIPKTTEDKSSRCAKSFGKGSTWDTQKNNGRGGCTAPTREAYEFILDKLISEGHASSLTEAEYVFKQLDDDYIESILNE